MASITERYAEVRSREWERGNYALFGVAMLSIAVAGLAAALFYSIHVIHEKKVPFVFPDEQGQLHPINLDAKEFKPENPLFELPIRATLYRWVKDYFERRRSGIVTELGEARMFMNVPKAAALKESVDNGLIDGFLGNASQPEVRITRAGESLTRIAGCGRVNQPVCAGSVNFNETSEGKHRLCNVVVEFGFGDPDDELVNSLGLAVTDWQGPECGPYRTERGSNAE